MKNELVLRKFSVTEAISEMRLTPRSLICFANFYHKVNTGLWWKCFSNCTEEYKINVKQNKTKKPLFIPRTSEKSSSVIIYCYLCLLCPSRKCQSFAHKYRLVLFKNINSAILHTHSCGYKTFYTWQYALYNFHIHIYHLHRILLNIYILFYLTSSLPMNV